MRFHLAHLLVVTLVRLSRKQVRLRVRELRALSQVPGDRVHHVFLSVRSEVLELFRSACGVGLKLNLELVLVVKLVEAEVLINVVRLTISELGQHPIELSVVGPIMHNQLSTQDVFSMLIFRDHAFDRLVDHLVGVLLNRSSHVVFFETAEILSMVSVQLLILLMTRSH